MSILGNVGLAVGALGMTMATPGYGAEPLPYKALNTPAKQSTPVAPAMQRAFVPRQIDTQALQMTGVRWSPKTLGTEELVMTGIRPRPVVVDTQAITMTGRR